MPLQSYKNAEFIHNELAGVSLPTEVLERMKRAGNEGADVGIEIAHEIFEALRPYVQGAYIVPAFDRYEAAAILAQDFGALATACVA
jgi:homocysteine S-methyltransferase